MIPDHCCARVKTGRTNTSATSPLLGFQKALFMKRTPSFMTALLTLKAFNILGLAFDEKKLARGSVVLLPQGTRERAGHILHFFCPFVGWTATFPHANLLVW
jgi:hypothetical protein